MSETNIHLWDAKDPDEEHTFPVTVYSEVIPRVGDDVNFWVDWPTHMSERVEPEPGQPMRVSGTVAKVRIDYRYMQGWGGTDRLHTLVSVDLDNYEATLFPHGKPREETE